MNRTHLFRRFLDSMGGHKYRYILGQAFVAACCIVSSVMPLVSKTIIDILTQGASSGMDFDLLYRNICLLSVLLVAYALLRWGGSVIIQAQCNTAQVNLRRRMMGKIASVPYRTLDRTNYGDLTSKIVNDTEVVGERYSEVSMFVTIGTVSLTVSVVLMLSLDVYMTLVLLQVNFAQLVGFHLVNPAIYRRYAAQRSVLGTMNGFAGDSLRAHDAIAYSHGNKSAHDRFGKLSGELMESTFRAEFYSSFVTPLMNVSFYLGFATVGVLSAIRISEGTLSVGTMVAFLTYAMLIQTPILRLGYVMVRLQAAKASAERIFAFLDEEDEEAVPDSGIEVGPGRVEFRDVVFGYEPGKPVIEGLSLDVEPGMKVAVVGPTGAGKSTIMSLLLRFYRPDSGYICIDGIREDEFSDADLGRRFCTVLQETWVFTGTVRENIMIGREDPDGSKLEGAIEALGLRPFIESLPRGIDSVVNEDVFLSEGQKQLVCIARAIIGDPPICILDEATSNMDTVTEAAVQRAFDSVMRGRTSFVVAHRISTILDSDLIIYFDGGRIAEMGTHAELLSHDGPYRRLYGSQFDDDR